ncbi:MAG: winged helix-turn-helix domain-containing protein, partial [Rhodocyclaceae bacterium]
MKTGKSAADPAQRSANEIPPPLLYQSLAERVAETIASGMLRPGERLLSVRQACAAYHLSPVTVLQAYYLLEARGLIEARPRSGYYVRARIGSRLPEPEMSRPLGA